MRRLPHSQYQRDGWSPGWWVNSVRENPRRLRTSRRHRPKANSSGWQLEGALTVLLLSEALAKGPNVTVA